ncbi:MAG: precorrin-6y C5,15-methyltransferase (decarboxylating) subunit CbiE [Cyanobacteria bacterium REEB417]|nr:precorrin-6y C5,15-methyltransferase (decarboxylating) subunit CbiE [Cyanobacteria bacterium REEB417]
MPIVVLGTDAAGVDGLPAALQDQLMAADLVVLPQRLLALQAQWFEQRELHPELLSSDQPAALIERIEAARQADQRIVVLASGDPLWFGIGRLLLERFGAGALRFQPAPSSLQLAFARIGRPWQDAQWISLHGREPEPLAARLQQRPTALAVLTDPQRGGAAAVRQILRASGMETAYGFWLCERLGHPDERVQQLALQQALPADLDPLHLVVLIAHEPPAPALGELPLFGIADGLWLQHGDRPGLMTKREVRIQLLAELRLPPTGVLWDVGAGVGSVGIEALRLRPQLQLWALEQRGGGAALIRRNAERFGVAAALAAGGVIEGRAPGALTTLPDPDRVLLGGGGCERAAIAAAACGRLRPGGVIVIPLATLEALAELRPVLERAGLQLSVTQIQAWRGAPLADGTRLAPLNPVLVLSAQKPAAG